MRLKVEQTAFLWGSGRLSGMSEESNDRRSVDLLGGYPTFQLRLRNTVDGGGRMFQALILIRTSEHYHRQLNLASLEQVNNPSLLQERGRKVIPGDVTF